MAQKEPGRPKRVTETDVMELMKENNRPVWTTTDIAEKTGVTRKTATKRVKSLADSGAVESIKVGGATAYYLLGLQMKSVSEQSDASDNPTPDEILASMDTAEPYTVADLQNQFGDCPRWIIESRLKSLCDNQKIKKKTHADGRVSYIRQQ